MDNCIVGDGCIVKRSIISNNVTLKENVHIPLGCVIAENVCLESSTVLYEYSQWHSINNVTLNFTPDSEEEDFDFKRLTIGTLV